MAQYLVLPSCTKKKQVVWQCMAMLLHLNENIGALQLLFKS